MRYRAVTAAVLVFAAGAAMGQSKTWDGDAGNLDWFADANWNPDGVPEAGDSVVVDAGGMVIAQSQPIEASTVEINSGLLMDNSSLTLTGQSQITGLTVQGCCTTVLDCAGTLTIDGTSAFLKAVRLNGLGSTILDGTIFCDDMLQTRGVQQTIIAGALSTDARIEMWDSSTVIVFGTVDMLDGASFESLNGGRATNRGVVQISGAGIATNFGEVETIGGTMRADTGVLRLRGKNSFSGGTIEAVNGGEVVLDSNQVITVHDTTVQGDSDVTFRSGSTTYTGTVTGNVQFPGTLEFRGLVQLGGTLRNTGDMTWDSARLEPAGFGGDIETTGYLTVLGSSVLEVPLEVQSGGTLEPRSSLTVYENVDIKSGGLLLFDVPGGLIGRPSGDEVGRVVVAGGVTKGPNFQQSDRTTIQVPLDLMPGGTVRSRSGVLRLDRGGVWSGGVVDTSDASATVEIMGLGVTYSVTGNVTVQGTGSVRFGSVLGRPAVDVAGVLTLNVNNSGLFMPSAVLDTEYTGAGQILNSGFASLEQSARLRTTLINNGTLSIKGGEVSGTLHNTAGVSHEGLINFAGGTVENSGEWTVGGSANAYLWSQSGGMFKNTGSVRAISLGGGNGSLDVNIELDNTGLVLADGSSVTCLDVKQIENGVLNGGRWLAVNGGSISFPGQGVHRIASAEVDGDGEGLPWAEDIEEIGPGGKVKAQNPYDFFRPLRLSDGELEIQGGEVTVPALELDGASKVKIGDGAKLTSDGDVEIPSVIGKIQGVIAQALLPAPAVLETPLLDLGGALVPGGEDRAGRFEIIGEVVCAPGAQVLMEIGGEDNTDEITITGPLALGGTLRVTFIDGFTPVGGESYRLIETLGGIFESFDAIDLPELPDGLEWDLYVGELLVGLAVVDGCVADWNGDGTVNTQDFLAYLNDWNTQRGTDCSGGGCSADLNGDSTVNTQDFLAFLNLWTAGC